MKCPYCGYSKTRNSKERNKIYTCSRCDYLFEVSLGEHVLDKILSVPFSSLIYTPIILVINYYVAKYTFTESIVSFGIFLSFHILMSASVLLFILFITSGRKSRIFLIKKSKGDFVSKIKEISPLVKMAILLGISAIIFPFIFQ